MTSPQTKSTHVEEAARNNAIWCDTLCRKHGAVGKFYDDLWICRQRVPRYYPNAVTLRAGDSQKQLQRIEELSAILPGGWGIKDSFNSLDLSALGFTVLFEAKWIWQDVTEHPFSDLAARWNVVDSADELAKWESAWSNGESPGNPAKMFSASLLDLPEIAFIAGYRDNQIFAGAIANLTGNVVGLSNVFMPGDDPSRWWADCTGALSQRFPQKPIVGYEHGDALLNSQRAGFISIGPLRVWLRNA